jgi:hypothetical protein
MLKLGREPVLTELWVQDKPELLEGHNTSGSLLESQSEATSESVIEKGE